jgi:hypothetical protein
MVTTAAMKPKVIILKWGQGNCPKIMEFARAVNSEHLENSPSASSSCCSADNIRCNTRKKVERVAGNRSVYVDSRYSERR